MAMHKLTLNFVFIDLFREAGHKKLHNSIIELVPENQMNPSIGILVCTAGRNWYGISDELLGVQKSWANKETS